MKWLVDALTAAAGHVSLNHGPDRELLAEAIIEQIPKDLVVLAIASAAAAVMTTSGVADQSGAIAREIANNAAQTVLALLLVGEEPPNAEEARKLARIGTAIADLPDVPTPSPEPDWQERVWREIDKAAKP